MIVQAEQELRKELERKEAAYAKFRETVPLLLQGEDGTNIHASAWRPSKINGPPPRWN